MTIIIFDAYHSCNWFKTATIPDDAWVRWNATQWYHRVGSHTWNHGIVYKLTPEQAAVVRIHDKIQIRDKILVRYRHNEIYNPRYAYSAPPIYSTTEIIGIS